MNHRYKNEKNGNEKRDGCMIQQTNMAIKTVQWYILLSIMGLRQGHS